MREREREVVRSLIGRSGAGGKGHSERSEGVDARIFSQRCGKGI